MKHTFALGLLGMTLISGPAFALCDAAHYVDVSGRCVQRPKHAMHAPSGATARCADQTYSFSDHRRGTCSHRGGVEAWLFQPIEVRMLEAPEPPTAFLGGS
jgi:hypothetical protein